MSVSRYQAVLAEVTEKWPHDYVGGYAVRQCKYLIALQF